MHVSFQTVEIPLLMHMMDVPETEYIVFEHEPFDYEQENRSMEEKMEKTMAAFDFAETVTALILPLAELFMFTMTLSGF